MAKGHPWTRLMIVPHFLFVIHLSIAIGLDSATLPTPLHSHIPHSLIVQPIETLQRTRLLAILLLHTLQPEKIIGLKPARSLSPFTALDLPLFLTRD